MGRGSEVQDGILGELVRVVMGVELIGVGWAWGVGERSGQWGGVNILSPYPLYQVLASSNHSAPSRQPNLPHPQQPPIHSGKPSHSPPWPGSPFPESSHAEFRYTFRS